MDDDENDLDLNEIFKGSDVDQDKNLFNSRTQLSNLLKEANSN